MGEERRYFRTSTKETVDGLIRNFELNMIPANQGVRNEFGILGEDDGRLFDALKWAYENGHLTREKLVELKDNGPGLTEAVNVKGNPYAPVMYETTGDFLRAADRSMRASTESV